MPSQYETVGGGEGSEVKGDTTYSMVDDCADETCKSRHIVRKEKNIKLISYKGIAPDLTVNNR